MTDKRSTMYEDNYFIYNGKLYKSELDYEVKTDNVNCKTLTAADSTLTIATIGTLNTTNLDLENSNIDSLKVDNIESKTADADIKINSSVDASNKFLTISNIRTPSYTSGTEYYRTNITNTQIRTGSDYHYVEIAPLSSYPLWIHGRGYHNKQKDNEIILLVGDTKTIIQPGYINLTNKLLCSNAEIRTSLYGNCSTVKLSNATATFLTLYAPSLKGDQLTTKTINGSTTEDNTESTTLTISASTTKANDITATNITATNEIATDGDLTVYGNATITGTAELNKATYNDLSGKSITTTDINTKGNIYCTSIKGGLENDTTITVSAPKTVFENEITATKTTTDNLYCSNIYGGSDGQTAIYCKNTLSVPTINFNNAYSTNGSLINFHNGIYTAVRSYYEGQVDKDTCIVNKKYVDNAIKGYTPTISTLENLTISKSLNVDNIYPAATTINAPITLNAPVNITGKATLDYSTFTEDNQIITKSFLDKQLSNYPPQSYLNGVISTINSTISSHYEEYTNNQKIQQYLNIYPYYPTETAGRTQEVNLTFVISLGGTPSTVTSILSQQIKGQLILDTYAGIYYVRILPFILDQLFLNHIVNYGLLYINNKDTSIRIFTTEKFTIQVPNKQQDNPTTGRSKAYEDYVQALGFCQEFRMKDYAELSTSNVLDYAGVPFYVHLSGAYYKENIINGDYSIYIEIKQDPSNVRYSALVCSFYGGGIYTPMTIPEIKIPLMKKSDYSLNIIP